MKHFGTFFDINYLSRGLVLYQSLVKVEPDFKLYILCLDDETFSFLQKQLYKQVILVPISELENFDKELFESKSNRKLVEYYFTISPCWPIYLIQKYNIPHICTLDADICFYSSPNEIFSNLDSYSIIITPHKFSKELEHFELYGKFNVSFQIFKNNSSGLHCLKSWRKQCLNWCKDELSDDNNQFADQKYLDAWPTEYLNHVKILDDDISGIAPWNLNRFRIEIINKIYCVNNKPIIYYHFQFFKVLYPFIAINGFKHYNVTENSGIKSLYLNYWKAINIQNDLIKTKRDSSIRGNVFVKRIEKLFQESTFFFIFFNKIYSLNSNSCPVLIRRILLKTLS